MAPLESLSSAQARKLCLLSQGLYPGVHTAKSIVGCIEQLGYVQLDSISVVERAHHHTLYNRLPGYQPEALWPLLASGEIFEYWSHAAALLPISHYRFSLPRKRQIASGERHWFDKQPKIAAQILARITAEGPLRARDFLEPRQGNSGWWDWKPAKRALEQLYMEGQLMVASREGFEKRYDLTERVLPNHVDTSEPSVQEYAKYLIMTGLEAQGLATTSELGYLRKGLKPVLQATAEQLCEAGEICQVNVAGRHYWMRSDAEKLLARRLSRNKLKILSPFDNLVIQRGRAGELFGFDYQIECYVPAGKRKHGYFALPLLLGDRFVGRIDAKLLRAQQTLELRQWSFESPYKGELVTALNQALIGFMQFNGANYLSVANKRYDLQQLQQPISLFG